MTLYDTLGISIEFDAAHFLPFYKGKCKYIHGHRWKVDIEIEALSINKETGMIIDFTKIKKYIDENYDHRILNVCPFDDITLANLENGEGVNIRDKPFKWGIFDNPTAENIADKMAADIYHLAAKETNIHSVSITVWESPKASITIKVVE